MAKAVLKSGKEVMPFFADKGMVRPSALQRRKIRMKAAGVDRYQDVENAEHTGWFRKYAADYKNYIPPRPQPEDSDYQQGVKLRAIHERARELAGEETGGWAEAWGYNDPRFGNSSAADKKIRDQLEAAEYAQMEAEYAAAHAEPEHLEPPETLIPASEATLDREETTETARRRYQAMCREDQGLTRLVVSGFASPFDQRYGSRPDLMNGTIMCNFTQLGLPRSRSAGAVMPRAYEDSMHRGHRY